MEKIAAIFFLQGGVMKFHDLFLFEMKGDRFDMFLSYVLDWPMVASIEFGVKNPFKWAGPAIEVVVDAKRDLIGSPR